MSTPTPVPPTPSDPSAAQRALKDVNAVRSWYRSSAFWGPAAAGAAIWQVLRVVVALVTKGAVHW